MDKTPRGTFSADTEVHITYNDQQMINTFARLNAKYDSFKEDLDSKKNTLQNIKDAESELELADDEEKIPVMEGEIFIYKSLKDTMETLAKRKEGLLSKVKKLENEMAVTKRYMNELKETLYSRFGNNINLESEEA